MSCFILQTRIQGEIRSELKKVARKPSLIPSGAEQQFVTNAINIAWSLVTAVPPFISSCDEHTFHDDLHEKSVYWEDDSESTYKLKYIRPVLYTNSLGAITQKGSVRNTKPDGGKTCKYY